jgi:hypothetical protein
MIRVAALAVRSTLEMIPDLVLGLPKAIFGAFIKFVAVPAHQRFLPPVAALPIFFSSSPRFAEPFHFIFVDGLSLTGKPTYAPTSHLIIDRWRESVTAITVIDIETDRSYTIDPAEVTNEIA